MTGSVPFFLWKFVEPRNIHWTQTFCNLVQEFQRGSFLRISFGDVQSQQIELVSFEICRSVIKLCIWPTIKNPLADFFMLMKLDETRKLTSLFRFLLNLIYKMSGERKSLYSIYANFFVKTFWAVVETFDLLLLAYFLFYIHLLNDHSNQKGVECVV